MCCSECFSNGYSQLSSFKKKYQNFNIILLFLKNNCFSHNRRSYRTSANFQLFFAYFFHICSTNGWHGVYKENWEISSAATRAASVVSVLATIFWSFVLITVLLEFRPSFKYATLVVLAELFQVTYMCIWTGSAIDENETIKLYYRRLNYFLKLDHLKMSCFFY